MRIVSCGITDVGLKRAHNEDNYLVNEELQLFVVADGMGGHAGGEFASSICVTTVEEVVASLESGESLRSEQPTEEVTTEDVDPVEMAREKVRYAIQLAGRRIYEKAADMPEYHGMGTTAVVLYVEGGNAVVAHVGDSRVYLVRDGKAEQLTDDHSLVFQKVKEGLITAEQAKTHKMRNVITRSLGYQEDVEVDVQVRAVRRGDRFLLCSDGLSGHVEADEIGSILESSSARDAARRLIDLACERGGEDNITAVIARIEES
jgi:serine/threonine protein phosphatase PrpC